MTEFSRKEFLTLAGLGGVVFASGLGIGRGAQAAGVQQDFHFVQLSDTHWGFKGDKANPDAGGTLQKAVARVNALSQQPDFIIFTGDLTHTTDDPQERRKRLTQFRDIVKELKVKTVRFIPGEHDASLDKGEAYKEFFGETHYTFDHKGVHFIALDNVSDPAGVLGDDQLAWLAADLKKLDKAQPIVVLAHRPLFDLAPDWDWATRDGAKAVELLTPYQNTTVFYGHIHQEHHHKTGNIAHHAATSLIFPQVAPGSQPKREPVWWDPAQPYKGLGFRTVEMEKKGTVEIYQEPVVKA
ncbi:MAG: metallophosphoesterase [Alphaproteobacteria bacterium]|nr:metallophosphoesterase [Alphaproteobacteria bacterium]